MQPIPDPQRTPLQLITGCVSQTTTALLVLVVQMAKHVPAMQETWVQSLGQEDHLETEMAIPSSILARRIPWTEELGRQQSMGS